MEGALASLMTRETADALEACERLGKIPDDWPEPARTQERDKAYAAVLRAMLMEIVALRNDLERERSGT